MLFWMCGATILLAIVLGGGTHSGFYGDVIVQLVAIPLLVAALRPGLLADHARRQVARLAFAVCLVCVAVVVVQIVPLPLDLWSGGKPLLSVSDTSTFVAQNRTGPPSRSRRRRHGRRLPLSSCPRLFLLRCSNSARIAACRFVG